MEEQSPDLGRGLFGYRRASVNQAIADRDIMLRQAEGRARAAEARAQELEASMEGGQEQFAEQHRQLGEQVRLMTEQLMARDREIAVLRAEVEDLSSRRAPGRPDTRAAGLDTLGEEVARVLRSAEESAETILERARTIAERQTTDSERQWRDLQVALARFVAWREDVLRVVDELKGRVADVRDRIADIPDRVRDAFAPLAESAGAADSSLADLAGDLSIPLIPLPANPPPGEQPAGGDEAGRAERPGDQGHQGRGGGEQGDEGDQGERWGGGPPRDDPGHDHMEFDPFRETGAPGAS